MKKDLFKKYACIALCVGVLMSLCACGDSTPADNDDVGTATTTKTDEGNQDNGASSFFEDGALVCQTAEVKKYDLQDTPTFSDDAVEATITDVEVTNSSVVITYTLKNNSAYNLACNAKAIELNGYTIQFNNADNDTIADKIAPNETAVRTMMTDRTELSDADMPYILSGSLRVVANTYYTDKEEFDYRNEFFLTFKTDCTNENKQYANGVTAYDQDGLKVIAQYIGWGDKNLYDDYLGFIRVLVINNTEKFKNIKFDEVFINQDPTLSLYPSKIYTYDADIEAGTGAYYVFRSRNKGDVNTMLNTVDKIESFAIQFTISDQFDSNKIPVNVVLEAKEY